MNFLPASEVDFPVLPCALQQTDAYGRAISDLGAETRAYVAVTGAGPVAKFRMVERNIGPVTFRWLPRGPVWAGNPSPEMRRNVLRALPRAVSSPAIWITAADTPGDAQLLPQTALMSPQYVAEVDLTEPEPARLAHQHVKWRNRLRHALRSGLQVAHRPLDIARDGAVLIREAEQQRDRKYRGLPPDFLMAWITATPRTNRLFRVRQHGETIAHIVVLLHRPVATYHIGWTGAEGRRLSAHNLALWEASNWLAAKGYHRFDLGTVDTEATPGLARFKIGSGATVRPLGPTGLRLPFSTPFTRNRHVVA